MPIEQFIESLAISSLFAIATGAGLSLHTESKKLRKNCFLFGAGIGYTIAGIIGFAMNAFNDTDLSMAILHATMGIAGTSSAAFAVHKTPKNNLD